MVVPSRKVNEGTTSRGARQNEGTELKKKKKKATAFMGETKEEEKKEKRTWASQFNTKNLVAHITLFVRARKLEENMKKKKKKKKGIEANERTRTSNIAKRKKVDGCERPKINSQKYSYTFPRLSFFLFPLQDV